MYRFTLKILIISLLVIAGLSSCKERQKEEVQATAVEKSGDEFKIKKLRAKVIRTLPHAGDKRYIQGFEIYNGILYESTGLKNQSSLKKIDPESGDLIASTYVEDVFAEGITIMNNELSMLTYKRGITLSYDPESLKEKGISFTYKTEGWGLTNDGTYLIMSDGSDKLYFRDPIANKVVKTLNVKYNNMPLFYLNELEYVNGKIYANVYGKGFIVAIDPESGRVLEDIDASHLSCSQLSLNDPEAVLNGIAYNAKSKSFYITGKKCDTIFEVVFE